MVCPPSRFLVRSPVMPGPVDHQVVQLVASLSTPSELVFLLLHGFITNPRRRQATTRDETTWETAQCRAGLGAGCEVRSTSRRPPTAPPMHPHTPALSLPRASRASATKKAGLYSKAPWRGQQPARGRACTMTPRNARRSPKPVQSSPLSPRTLCNPFQTNMESYDRH